MAESPKLTAALAGVDWDTKYHVTADYNYRAHRFADRRLLLVGDAACFLDPMFSTGVFLALLSAKLAAGEVISAHHRGRALSWWARRRYTRRLGANVATLERMVLAFYDDASFSVFMERSAPLRMIPAVNALVAGHSDPPWPVRWRYWLFLLVCRLQRWRPVVPVPSTSPRGRSRQRRMRSPLPGGRRLTQATSLQFTPVQLAAFRPWKVCGDPQSTRHLPRGQPLGQGGADFFAATF